MGALSRVDTIKDRAVVNEKVDAEAALPREGNEHEVVAEDLHLADTLARATGNLDVELVPGVIDVDHKAAGRLVEILRELREQPQRLGPKRAPLFIVHRGGPLELHG